MLGFLFAAGAKNRVEAWNLYELETLSDENGGAQKGGCAGRVLVGLPMKNAIRSGLTTLAMLGMVSANPALAAGATRSAAALPLLAASVGSVPYTKGAENSWHCAQVSDGALKIDKKWVFVDQAGRVVLDPKSVPFDCQSPEGGYKVGATSRFPFEILLGILGVGGLALGLAGGGGNDSAG